MNCVYINQVMVDTLTIRFFKNTYMPAHLSMPKCLKSCKNRWRLSVNVHINCQIEGKMWSQTIPWTIQFLGNMNWAHGEFKAEENQTSLVTCWKCMRRPADWHRSTYRKMKIHQATWISCSYLKCQLCELVWMLGLFSNLQQMMLLSLGAGGIFIFFTSTGWKCLLQIFREAFLDALIPMFSAFHSLLFCSHSCRLGSWTDGGSWVLQ